MSLARVLAVKPTTILLDEPLAGIDAETTRELKNELKRIHKDGKTIIHVTYDQIEGFSLGDRVAVMKSGEIVQIGKAKEVFAKPRNEFVTRFLGYENIFKAHLLGKEDTISFMNANGVKLKVSGDFDTPEITIAVRPEDITVHLSQIEDRDANVLRGTVVEYIEQGSFITITIDAGLILQAVLTKRSLIEKNLEAGQKVLLSFRIDAVKVIEQISDETETKGLS